MKPALQVVEVGTVTEVLEPDVCVVGAGPGSFAAAALAASLGAAVVLVAGSGTDRGPVAVEAGRQAIIAAARAADTVRRAGHLGVGTVEPRADIARIGEHARHVMEAAALNVAARRLAPLGVRVVEADGRFADPNTLVAGETSVRPRRFVIATGSRPVVPDLPGLHAVRHLTEDTAFDLDRRPERLVVLGGDATAVEMAQACRRLGMEVVLVEAGPRLLAGEDPELAAVVEAALRRDGVALRLDARVERIEARGATRLAVAVEHEGTLEFVTGSHLLVALGRRPEIDGLGLEAAGIAQDEDGVRVDARLRTTNRRVYAIGHAVGGTAGRLRSTHAADHQAGLVVRHALFRVAPKFDGRLVPRVTFADPELAVVGATEGEARAERRAFRILRWPMAENDRARAANATCGHLKALVTPRGNILGCAIAGFMAGELLAPWVVAMGKGLRVQDLAGAVFAHPTLSEMTKSAATDFLRPRAQAPSVRRLVGALRRLG